MGTRAIDGGVRREPVRIATEDSHPLQTSKKDELPDRSSDLFKAPGERASPPLAINLNEFNPIRHVAGVERPLTGVAEGLLAAVLESMAKGHVVQYVIPETSPALAQRLREVGVAGIDRPVVEHTKIPVVDSARVDLWRPVAPDHLQNILSGLPPPNIEEMRQILTALKPTAQEQALAQELEAKSE